MARQKQVADVQAGSSSPELSTQFVTFRLSRLNAKLVRQAKRILHKNSDFTVAQWRVLSLISVLESCILSDIVNVSGLDAGQVSRNARDLIEKGHVLSENNHSDQRRHTLSLSQSGKQEYQRLLPTMRARQAALLDSLDPEKLDAFYEVIALLEERSEQSDFVTSLESNQSDTVQS